MCRLCAFELNHMFSLEGGVETVETRCKITRGPLTVKPSCAAVWAGLQFLASTLSFNLCLDYLPTSLPSFSFIVLFFPVMKDQNNNNNNHNNNKNE